MGRSLTVAIYLLASRLAERPAKWMLRRRLARGKEDPDRLQERLGHASLPRPQGRLIWFHAASVGESLSLIDLIKAQLAEHPDLYILLTTGTRTSAAMLADRLPERAFHQYVPVDAARAVRRFLDHWKPDLAIWTESELWPALLHHTKRSGCPVLLVNARISENSARRMRWFKGYSSSLLDRFDAIMAQDDIVENRLYRLGAPADRIMVTGSLKDSAQPLEHDPEDLKRLTKALGGRAVWLAASTHDGEEVFAMDAHRHARRTAHGLVLIIAPRHPDRGTDIARMLRSKGWRVAQRSAGEALDRNTEIYVADTMGEMGLWYRLCPTSFIGGSLVEVGGHNPFEPALLGSAILHGPHVFNFENAYARFRRAGASVLVKTPEELGPKLVQTLSPDRAAELATAAWTVSSEGADVAQQVMAVIDRYLPERKGA